MTSGAAFGGRSKSCWLMCPSLRAAGLSMTASGDPRPPSMKPAGPWLVGVSDRPGERRGRTMAEVEWALLRLSSTAGRPGNGRTLQCLAPTSTTDRRHVRQLRAPPSERRGSGVGGAERAGGVVAPHRPLRAVQRGPDLDARDAEADRLSRVVDCVREAGERPRAAGRVAEVFIGRPGPRSARPFPAGSRRPRVRVPLHGGTPAFLPS